MYGKHYGLTGVTINVKHIKGDVDEYPWNGIAVPVLITAEYPRFLVGIVQPHYAPKGFGLSHPYPITIDKHDLHKGELIIVGGNFNE